MKNIGIAGCAIAALMALLLAGLGISSCHHLISNPLHQAGRVIDKTVDADNVVYNYEWFKSQYREVLAMDQKIGDADSAYHDFTMNAGPRDAWDFRDKEEFSRLRTVLDGMRNVRSEMVAQYNARAAMANRSIFMGADVPSSLQ